MPTYTPQRSTSPGNIVVPPRPAGEGWPLERVLFLMAGTMAGLSAVLSALVNPWFLLLTGFVALNQLAFVAFGNCPSSLVLRRLGVKPACER